VYCVLFSMRNSHGLAHGKSDLYVVVHLEAEDGAVVSIDEDEIDAAAWHDLEEVAAWTTHPINRECLIFQFVQNSYSSATVR
jgi:hypothetical protein